MCSSSRAEKKGNSSLASDQAIDMLSPIRSSGQPIDNHNTRFHRQRAESPAKSLRRTNKVSFSTFRWLPGTDEKMTNSTLWVRDMGHALSVSDIEAPGRIRILPPRIEDLALMDLSLYGIAHIPLLCPATQRNSV
jgi:hypothetical protein